MFNKEFWQSITQPQALESYPNLPCPYCESENLKLDIPTFSTRNLSGRAQKAYIEKVRRNKSENSELKNFIKEEESTLLKFIAAFALIAETAEEAKYSPSQFISFFKCEMCNESVSATGFAKMPLDSVQQTKQPQIKLESLNPPIHLFRINNTTPESINNELLASFNLFFSDICSSGNRLRRAIENLCAELGYDQGNLHRRIQAMRSEYPQESGWLESLKLVGNEATHANRVTEEDILDSYEVFEVVLDIFRRRVIEPKINTTVKRLESKYNKNKEPA